MAEMKTTVLGARGFIGSAVARRLAESGAEVFLPVRDDPRLWSEPLGRVIYCAGLTADFRRRPFDTIEAHVGLLNRLLRDAEFEKIVYLSSTRVYQHSPRAAEDAPLVVDACNPGDLYNASKLTGELLCGSSGRPAVVARLSNVYGPDWTSENFLIDVIRQAIDTGRVTIRGPRESAKDYVALDDVVRWLIALAGDDSTGTFNLAGGRNISHGEIGDLLEHSLDCSVEFAEGDAAWIFPQIDIERITAAHGPPRNQLLADLPRLAREYRESLAYPHRTS